MVTDERTAREEGTNAETAPAATAITIATKARIVSTEREKQESVFFLLEIILPLIFRRLQHEAYAHAVLAMVRG
jgi:hypothetical protein